MSGAPGFISTDELPSGIASTHDDDRIRDEGAGEGADLLHTVQPDPVGDGSRLPSAAGVEPGGTGLEGTGGGRQADEDGDGPGGSIQRREVSFKLVPPRKRACDNCPFRSDSTLSKSLTRTRLNDFKEIVDNGGWFPCHKSSSARLEMQEDERWDGTTDWDWLELEDRLAILAKEQECVGGRIWREQHREPTVDEMDP